MQNNKQAAQEYVNHGFKLCAVRGKEPFQKGWEKKPITDLNLFDHNGIGLAANQVGVLKRVITIRLDPKKQEFLALVNPKITKKSNKKR